MYKALPKMIAGFDGCGVVAILSECTPPVFPLVILLANSAGNMLHGSWNGLRSTFISDNQVMVDSDDKVENGKAITLSGFK